MQPRPDEPQWFVLRDLKRPNAKSPAYKTLPTLGIDVFTPLHWVVKTAPDGSKTRALVPQIAGLLFARALRADLDPIIARTATLQYQFLRGAAQNTPMVVPTADMNRFLHAVNSAKSCLYYTPDEITPDMLGRQVRIVGGPLDGLTGHLLKRRGTRTKRLLISLQNTLVASLTLDAPLLQLLP